MEKLKQESADLTEQNIDKIAALFPNVITETKDADGKLKKAINFTLLQQMLQGDLVDGDECYEFTWVGKKQSIIDGNKSIRKTLRPCVEESKNWDKTENLYIEGDNLEVLKLLQGSYLNSIKMMYFDPPYNTGNDFLYRDNFTSAKDEYDDDLGMFDEDDNRLFQNNESNGRFHSDWCSMMYPRLQLASNLLTDDGVIFVSIDDNEVDNLRKICDEVFGARNFVANLAVQLNPRGRHLDNFIAKTHESILIYAKDSLKKSTMVGFEKSGNMLEEYDKVDEKGNQYRVLGLRNRNQSFNPITRPNLYYPIYVNPLTSKVSVNKDDDYSEEVLPITTDNVKTCWTWGKNKVISENNLLIGIKVNNNWQVFRKDYLMNENGEVALTLPKSLWTDKEINNDYGKKSIKELFGKNIMDFPKSPELIQKIISCSTRKDSIIMDFFSGSATTAHAMMQLNAEDGENRKFIMVQLPEVCDEKSEAFKAGYKNICEIGKERIRRAGKQICDNLEQEIKNKSSVLDKMLNAKPSSTAQLFSIEEQKEMHSNAFKEHGQPVFNELQEIQRKLKTLDTGFRVLKLDSTNMKDVYYGAGEYSQQMLLDLESNIKTDRNDLDLLYGVLLDWGVSLQLPHTTETIGGVKVHFVNDTDLVACFAEKVNETVIREIAKRKPLRVVFRDSSFANSPDKINVTEIFKTISPETTVKVI